MCVSTSPMAFCFACVRLGKGVDDIEEVTCFSGSNKGSNSEVQSLSSFQSDSGDDNGKHVAISLRAKRAYFMLVF